MFKYVAVCMLVASAFAVPAPNNQPQDCLEKHDDDILSCMAVKVATALDRAARSNEVHVLEGVTFVKDAGAGERSGKALKSETEILEELPRDMADRTVEIAGMLYESAVSFFKSHSLKVNIPEGQSLSRALGEARAKSLKKFGLPLLAAVGVKIFALAPILLGGLVLLVAKALIVGKIALLIAGILAFQRLFSGGSAAPFAGGFPSTIFGKNPAPAAWNDQGSWGPVSSNQVGYQRSFDEKSEAQKLAYNAQAPTQETSQ